MPKLSVISLFSGAMGLDLGLEQAGFQIDVAVECNKFAAETIRKMRPNVHLIQKRIEETPTSEILKAAGLRAGEPTLVVGGPSCQSFSTAGQRESIRDPRGGLFRHFLRVVRQARPRFFVMENVTGLLSAAIRHRPLKERGPGHPRLDRDEEFGSAFNCVLRELKETGYYIVFNVLNAADYGVPQMRERLLFIGSRDGEPIHMPSPTHAQQPVGGLETWVTLKQALDGLDDPEPVIKRIAAKWQEYLKLIPPGGCWRDLPDSLQAAALGKAYKSWGGRKGFFRRLHWDKPAPALTTRPESKATMLCHPDHIRTLSVREYAKLQQFPDSWQFAGGKPQQYMQVGNAVPVGLGKAIGFAIRRAMRQEGNRRWRGRIVCASAKLLSRLINGRRTRLNPVRMRKVKSIEAMKDWMNGRKSQRLSILRYVENTVTINSKTAPTAKATLQSDAATPERVAVGTF
jgi:DNA (cytosine-5)-methyltransferase 1